MAASSIVRAAIEPNSRNLKERSEMKRFRKSIPGLAIRSVLVSKRGESVKRLLLTDSEISQPPARFLHVFVQSSNHNARVFTGQIVRSLSHVERDKSGPLPELEEEWSHSVRNSEVIEVFRSTFGKSLKKRRHLRSVSDSDLVRRE